MDDLDSFTEVVTNLKGLKKSRDPRSARVASVTSALLDVVEGDVTSGKLYASTVTTLEGTLHQDHADVNVILDSLATQAALLRILGVVVSHVSPATLGATIGMTSRVLRGSVSSSLSILGTQDGQTTSTLLDTNDGLGALSTVLSEACKTIGEVLRQLPRTATDESAVKQLLTGTLIRLLQDTRKQIQNSAKDALNGLLLMGSPQCHPVILKTTTKYVDMHIKEYLKHPSNQRAIQNLIGLTGFLGRSLISLNFTSIGGRLMTILVDLLNEESTASSPARPVFVANSHASTLKILTMNSILSAILSLLEADEDTGLKKAEKLNSFASRVLASLIQARPTLVFREGAAEIDLLESGRTMYGEILISSTQRVLNGTAEIGAKLLPMVLQHLLGLSRSVEADDSEGNDIAHTLFAEVSQLFRVQLHALSRDNPALHENCSQNCLRVLKSVCDIPFDETYTPVLNCLALLLQQMKLQREEEIQCIQSLINLRCDDKIDKNLKRQIDDTFMSFIQGIGLEKFWTVIDFPKLCNRKSLAAVPNQYSWMIDVMKLSGGVISDNKLHLSFFHEQVLPLARKFDALYVKGSTAGNVVFRSQVINLWALFPVFCRSPVDLDVALPNLSPILIKAMNDENYPEFVTTICTGLDTLATGIHCRKDQLEELIEGEDGKYVRTEAKVMEQISMKLLPSLFKLVDSLHDINSESSKKSETNADEMETDDNTVEKNASRVSFVTRSIASIAKVTPNAQIQRLFARVVQKMLESSQNNDDKTIEKKCSLLTLSQALVISECLNDSSISLLYRSLKPIIRTDETPPRIQKRAYKVMAEICNRYHSFVAEPERLKEVTELLSSTTSTSQISARFMRLKCLTFVIEGFEDSEEDARRKITSSLIGETLLCLKDYNAKTRDAAFKLLLAMNKVHGSSSNFIQTVAAAIGSNTSHMRSAAVTALSRLVFDTVSDDTEVQNLLPALLKTVLILSDDPSREVTKSMVVFVRILVSAASTEQLEPLLPDILNGLLKYHKGKDRFREKIKIIIKKLVKYFGYETLMPYIPPSDIRLLTHMRKLSEREQRRKLTRRKTQREETRDYQAMEDSNEEDSDDGRTLMTGMTKMTRMSGMSRMSRISSGKTLKRRHTETTSLAQSTKFGKSRTTVRIKSDADGNVTDVKDLKNVRFAETHDNDSDEGEDMEFDSSGKLVVREIEDEVENKDDGGTVYSFKSRHSVSDRSAFTRNSRKDSNTKISKATSKPGSAYKAKKAGGDSKKKGQKFEPYAYMQLDGRNYSKKNRRRAVEQMSSVVQRGNKRQKR